MVATPSLFRSALTVAWTFLVLGIAWVWVSTRYDSGLVTIAQAFLPDEMTLALLGSSIAITFTAG